MKQHTQKNVELLHQAIAANPTITLDAIAREMHWELDKFKRVFKTVRHEYVKEWKRKTIKPVN